MIRKIKIADFDFIFNLYMHPLVNPFLLYEIMEAADFKPIFDELEKAGIIYIFEKEGKDAGMFKLIPQLHRNHHIAYLGGLAIDPNFSGKGYGETMLQQIIILAKQMGFLRIELSADVNNLRAIRLYEKLGFQKEGLLRKYTHLIKESRYVDEVMMAYLC